MDLLLTPNRRLSAVLLKKYNQSQLLQDKTSWISLHILPFSSWLTTLADTSFILLNSNQEQIIWEEILKNSADTENLLQLSATAELAKSAWGILKQWQVDLDHPALRSTVDTYAFQKWAVEFQKKCKKNNWIDTYSLTNLIIKKIKSGHISLPQTITLIGFTEISPQYQAVLNACEQQGSSIKHDKPESRNISAQQISLEDTETEIYTLARWAKNLLEKNTSIACVIPNLEKLRERVISIFSDVFVDANQFNISAGKNLASYPIIYTAFQILHLQEEKTSPDRISHLLRSPFLTPTGKKQLRHITKNTKQRSLRASEWVNVFMQQLTALGWPGERSLNSIEYQVVQRWLELLSEYAGYDIILAPKNYQEALHYLIQLTTKTVFQPQSPDAPVQILGILEAADMPFDYMWVMGLDDMTWPPSPKPNPFIPQHLQTLLKMPRATAEREFLYCKNLTEQLQNSAQHVIFSHALQNADAELRPSALLNNIEKITPGNIKLSDFITPANIIYQSKMLDYLIDDMAPAVTPDEKIHGGTAIFKLQAACPFKAFAELRLHAKPVDPPMLGLPPKERGIVTHKVLEIIWKTLKDLDTLQEKTPEQLDELVYNAVQEAMQNKLSTQPRYLALEIKRFKKIIHEWLAFEKTRDNFKVIATEESSNISISNLAIQLRVDRIDEISDGTQLIIDYKTGKEISTNDWFGERPNEPQLPLYCITHPDTHKIAFAQLYPGKIGMKISKELQIQTWRNTLEKLAIDFSAGRANVDPKNPVTTCEYCHLHAFCRIHEKQ